MNMEQAIYNKARKDKFVLILSVPEILKNIERVESPESKYINFDHIQYTIYGNITPDIVVPSVGVSWGGQEIKISSHSREPYGHNHVKFDVDNEYKNWWVIYRWLNVLNDELFSYYNEDQTIEKGEAEKALQKYSTNFIVYAMDEYNNRKMKFTYTGCFPVSLQKIDYDERDPDIVKSEFEFAYSFFEAEPI